MQQNLKILAIVPAYNEEESIVKVINDIKNFNENWDVLIINDGSRDNTSEIARSTGRAIVIDLVTNLGIGGAVQTGFKYARNKNYDIAFQFDGDGQHIASEANKIVQDVAEGKSDVCIGSRFVEKREGWKSSFLRRMGIYTFKFLNSMLIGQKVTDNTSGLRAYNKEAIEFLSFYYPMDYPEPEAVILLGRNNFRIKEIYTEMLERFGGVSSINITKGAYYMIKVSLAIIITALRPVTRKTK